MGKQQQCARCDGKWEWDCKDVHDFNLPTGKRIWPCVCSKCRKELEQGYKSGKISGTELSMEFSTISARAAKKCAVSPGDVQRALEQMKSFTPRRRGK